MLYLDEVIHERGYPNDIDLIQRRDATWYNFLLVTRGIQGPFLNVGPAGVEEVLQDGLRDMLKPGEQEERARKMILRELGRWIRDRAFRN